jgi:hypothetical protein
MSVQIASASLSECRGRCRFLRGRPASPAPRAVPVQHGRINRGCRVPSCARTPGHVGPGQQCLGQPVSGRAAAVVSTPNEPHPLAGESICPSTRRSWVFIGGRIGVR